VDQDPKAGGDVAPEPTRERRGGVLRVAAQTLIPTWLTLVALLILELTYVQFTYVRELLFAPQHVLVFAFQAVVVASVLTIPIAIGRLAFRAASTSLARSSILRANWPSLVLMTVCLLGLSYGLVHCEHGGMAPPRLTSAWGLILAPAAIYCIAAMTLSRTPAARADATLMSVLAVGLTARFILKVSGRNPAHVFGLTDPHGVLKTWFGILVAVCFFLMATALPRTPASKRFAMARWALAAIMLVVVHRINATSYVDSYVEFHEGLTFVAIALAFVLIEPVATSWTRAWSRRRIMIACGVIVVGVSGLFVIRVPSVAHYVGSVHTVYQRYAFEALHRRAPGLFAASIPLDTRPTPNAPLAPVAVPRAPLNGVVAVFLDAKRPENIGLYGKSPGNTPRIDKLFGSGYVFTRAYSSTNATAESFPAIYSGRHAGSRGRPTLNLVDMLRGESFIATLLTNQWYAENLIPDNASPEFGEFTTRIVAQETTQRPTPALAGAYATAQLIPKTGRFLLVVHVIEHGSGEVEMAEIDELVGRLGADLEAAGRSNDTFVLLTADHGFQNREHGRTDYGHTLFDEEIRVPLLVRVPGLPGGRIDTPVSSIDHLPTIAEAVLGKRLPTNVVHGTSYLPVLQGSAPDPHRVIYAVTLAPPTTGVIRGNTKLIHWQDKNAYGLFDHVNEPSEQTNLVEDGEYRETLASLARLLGAFERDLQP
jgi:hypothetical protein